MTTNCKRLLAFLLAFALSFSPLAPVGYAIAADNENDGIEVVKEGEATVDLDVQDPSALRSSSDQQATDSVCVVEQDGLAPVYFTDLQEAIDSLPDNGNAGAPITVPDATIRMLSDVDLGVTTLIVDKKFVLDLNGCEIVGYRKIGSQQSSYAIAVTAKGTTQHTDSLGILTITDSAGNGAIRQGDTGYFTVIEVKGDTPDEELYIKGGRIEGYCAVNDGRSNSRVGITGGEIVGWETGVSLNAGAIEISGDTIIRSNNVGIVVGSATVDITGGVVEAAGMGIGYEGSGKLTVGEADQNIVPIISGSPSIGYIYDPSAIDFTILNGHFSDDSGNDENIVRRDGLMLRMYPSEGDIDYYLQPARCVCKIVETGVEYESLDAAQEAVYADQTIQLTQDIALGNGSFTVYKDFTLDLAGKTISTSNNDAVIFVGTENSFDKAGNLIIKDSSTDGTGAISNGAGYGIIVGNSYSALELQGGTVSGTKGIETHGVTTVDGGKVVGTEVGINAMSDFKITGDPEITGGDCAIVSQNGLGTINGGTIAGGESGVGVRTTGNGRIEVTEDSTAKISGGTSVEMINPSGQVADPIFAINGGSFSDDAGNADSFTRPEGKELTDPDGDAWFTLNYHYVCEVITPGQAEPQGYISLDAAQEAITSGTGQTIRLCEDIDLDTGTFTVYKEFTLDLNGKTLTASGNTDDDHQVIDVASTYSGSPGKLTVVDSEGDGQILQNMDHGYCVKVGNGGDFTLESGKVAGYYGVYGIGPSGSTSINGGTVTGGYVGVQAGDTLSISGKASITANNYGVIVNGSTASIYGGTISATDYEGVGVNAIGNGSSVAISDADDGDGPFISGGTHGASVKNASNGNFTINGGAFSDNAGNGDNYARPEGQILKKGDDDWYRLGELIPVCENTRTHKQYESIQEAVNDAQSGDEIKMMADYTTEDYIEIDRAITLDLAGYEVTIDKYGVYIVEPVIFTVMDSSEDDTGMLNSIGEYGSAVILYDENSHLILESGTLKGASGVFGYCWPDYSTVDILGGTIIAENYGIYADGTINISGDAVISSQSYGVITDAATVTISGGTVEATGQDGVGIYLSSYNGGNGTVNITGGTISGGSQSIENEYGAGSFNISGGFFSDDEGNDDAHFSLPAGMVLLPAAEKPGFYSLQVDAVCINVTTGVEYADLQTALDEASDNDEIKMLKDVDVSDTGVLVPAKKLTLDLNGCLIDSSYTRATMTLHEGADLTVKDESDDETGTILNSRNGDGFAIVLGEEQDESCAFTLLSGTVQGGQGIHEGSMEPMKTKVVISGGKVIGDRLQGISSNGSVDISGSAIVSGVTAGVYSGAGQVTISGGTVEGTGANGYGVHLRGLNGYAGAFTGSVTIDDGIIIGNKQSVYNDDEYGHGAFAINGGYYSDDTGNDTSLYTLPTGMTLQRGDDEQYFTLKESGDGIIYTCSLALNDRIDIRFYVSNLPAGDDPSNYTVRYWTNIEGESNAHESGLQAVEGYDNKYTVGAVGTFAAMEMTTPTQIEVYRNGQDEPIKVVTDYSVRKYCDNKITQSTNKKLVDLCQAVLDYGTYAQLYFNYEIDDLANANHSEGLEDRVDPVVVGDEHQMSVDDPIDTLKRCAITLSLESRTELNFYFTPADGITTGDIEVTIAGTVIEGEMDLVDGDVTVHCARSVTEDGRVRVAITDINPTKLDHKFTAVATAGGKSRTLVYSPLSYSYNKQNSETEYVASVAKALYNYWVTAKALV